MKKKVAIVNKPRPRDAGRIFKNVCTLHSFYGRPVLFAGGLDVDGESILLGRGLELDGIANLEELLLIREGGDSESVLDFSCKGEAEVEFG